MVYHSTLPSWHLEEKRVFLRADLNVPLLHGQIEDDFKLHELIPTLNLLLEKKAKIILATHLGNPDQPQPELSTRYLLPWFVHQGFSIIFCSTLEHAYQESKKDPQTILLLENLRFYPGEKKSDAAFAQELKKLAHYYVNDAFGTLHRKDCSVFALPSLFEPNHKTFGLLIQKELNDAEKLVAPKHPFCLILGGGKAEDKIPLIKTLLTKINYLLLCPGVDRALIQKSSELEFIRTTAIKERITIEFPEDYLVGKSLTEGPFVIKKSSELIPQDFAIRIGPETQKKYAALIRKSNTTFYNGLMGTLDNPESLAGVHALFTAMQECDFALVGGGDSTAAARKLGFEKSLHLSTGGGSLLAYLSNQKLPALEVLLN